MPFCALKSQNLNIFIANVCRLHSQFVCYYLLALTIWQITKLLATYLWEFAVFLLILTIIQTGCTNDQFVWQLFFFFCKTFCSFCGSLFLHKKKKGWQNILNFLAKLFLVVDHVDWIRQSNNYIFGDLGQYGAIEV